MWKQISQIPNWAWVIYYMHLKVVTHTCTNKGSPLHTFCKWGIWKNPVFPRDYSVPSTLQTGAEVLHHGSNQWGFSPGKCKPSGFGQGKCQASGQWVYLGPVWYFYTFHKNSCLITLPLGFHHWTGGVFLFLFFPQRWWSVFCLILYCTCAL